MMFFGPFCVILFWSSLALAQGLPACALQCLLASLEGQSVCLLTDIACICADETSRKTTEKCVLSSCSVIEALTARNASETLCEKPVRDISHITPIVTGISGGVAIIAVVVRSSTNGALSVDNIFAVAALVSGIPVGVIGLHLSGDGFGRDIWTLWPDEITRTLKVIWISEVSYLLSVAFTKLSFLFFCLRIFPRKSFRMTVYILIGFVVAYGVAFTVTCVFNCTPLSYNWTRWDGQHIGKCINFNAFAWAHAGINIFLDITLVALPLPELLALSLSARKKMFVILMFSFGAFTTVISIVRLQSLVQFSASTNPTYDNVPTAYWSILEVYTGIFCVCLPAIRRLLTRKYPSCFSSSGSDSKSQPYVIPDMPNKPSIGNQKTSQSVVAISTTRTTGITRTVDTKIERRLKEEDEINLVDMLETEAFSNGCDHARSRNHTVSINNDSEKTCVENAESLYGNATKQDEGERL